MRLMPFSLKRSWANDQRERETVVGSDGDHYLWGVSEMFLTLPRYNRPPPHAQIFACAEDFFGGNDDETRPQT